MATKRKVTRIKKVITKPEVTPTKKVKEPEIPKKEVWVVLNGGLALLGQKTSYQKGDQFEAYEWEIPEAFKSSLRCLTPKEERAKRPVKVAPKYFLREIVPTADELDAPDFVQKYDIVDSKDKIISDNLTKEEAEEALKHLN